MSGTTGVAIVGCGYVVDHYMATAAAHPELRLLGVYDIDEARARTVSRAYRLRSYPTLEDLVADPEVELVLNLASIGSHFDVTKQLLLAGKHVYSESR